MVNKIALNGNNNKGFQVINKVTMYFYGMNVKKNTITQSKLTTIS